MLIVIIPEKLSVRDETHRNKQKVTTVGSLPLCCSLVSIKKNLKKDKYCPFPDRGRRASFTKPDDVLP